MKLHLAREAEHTTIEYIKSDLYRYCGSLSLVSFMKEFLLNRAFRLQCTLRLCQSSGITKAIGALLYFMNRTKRTVCIPKGTKIGLGLYIGHNGPIVINPTTVIGDNVNLSQFTTIGSNHNKAATIGSNVYIGPNVCIVEDVTIGDNVTIGAGSVVTKSIPSNATAAGNYAKVLNYRNPGRYIQHKWTNK